MDSNITVIRYTDIDTRRRGWQGRLKHLLNSGWRETNRNDGYIVMVKIVRPEGK